MSRQKAATAILDRFIIQCLEPLPSAELEDIAYNKLARKARAEPWRSAYLTERFWRGLLDASLAADIIVTDFPERAWKLSAEVVPANVRKHYRVACAALLRTPAPHDYAVAWKKQQAKGLCPDVPKDQLAALIAADEAFLAAHPVSSRKRGGAPQ